MSDIEQRVRDRAYWLWEEAGRPDGRSDEFWFAAWHELEGEPVLPPVEEPPVVAAQHGVPTGMPGERIAEAGIPDDRLAELAVPARAKRAER